jgi:hypothetical protein
MNLNNDFDIREKCINRLNILFDELILNQPEINKIIGENETYYKAEVFKGTHKIEIYVYYDGAEFTIDKRSNRQFEMADYDSENQRTEEFEKQAIEKSEDRLVEDFITNLRETIISSI